jgi:hypothetical protein
MADDTTVLHAVELDFLDSAPYRFEYRAEIDATPVAVFAAISADPQTWTWFPGLEPGGYEGDEIPTVGTRRWVRTGGVKYRETILAWDEPRRWAYRVDETSAPIFRALLEDWVIEPTTGGTATLLWTFAFEPFPYTEEMMAGARDLIGATFSDAAEGLAAALQ